jgi:chromosome segregation ATPase
MDVLGLWSKLQEYATQNWNLTNDLQYKNMQLAGKDMQLQDSSTTINSMNTTIYEYSREINKGNQQINEYANQIAAKDVKISDLEASMATTRQCTPSDAANITNIINTYSAASNQNAEMISSILVQDNVKRLDQAATQNIELQQKKAELIASIEQHERDFIDLRDALPEVLPNTSVHVLDDYTMWVLVLSYGIFAISMIFYYCYTGGYSIGSIVTSTVGAAVLTIFLGVLMILLL